MELKKIPTTKCNYMHGDRLRFRNGTQEDPKYTTQTTWRLIEIQQWNSGNPNIGLQHFMQMKQRVHKHSVGKTLAGLYNILSRAEKRKKNFGRAIHIAGHNFAHTHPA